MPGHCHLRTFEIIMISQVSFVSNFSLYWHEPIIWKQVCHLPFLLSLDKHLFHITMTQETSTHCFDLWQRLTLQERSIGLILLSIVHTILYKGKQLHNIISWAKKNVDWWKPIQRKERQVFPLEQRKKLLTFYFKICGVVHVFIRGQLLLEPRYRLMLAVNIKWLACIKFL